MLQGHWSSQVGRYFKTNLFVFFLSGTVHSEFWIDSTFSKQKVMTLLFSYYLWFRVESYVVVSKMILSCKCTHFFFCHCHKLVFNPVKNCYICHHNSQSDLVLLQINDCMRSAYIKTVNGILKKNIWYVKKGNIKGRLMNIISTEVLAY